MSDIAKRLRQIKEQKLFDGQRAFVVEGHNDITSYEHLFQKRFATPHPDWDKTWRIVEGGKKANVLEILQAEPTWLGLVDKDEWSPAEISDHQKRLPNLLILPRYCMENYLIVPDELWSILPAHQRTRIPGGHPELEGALLDDDLERWVRHGVLWSTINPLWHRIRDLGFNNALLDPQSVPSNDQILQKLHEWHAFLEPEAIFTRFQDRMSLVSALPRNQQLTQWVHGKAFWNQKVIPTLNSYFPQQNEQQWRNTFWRTLPVPADWAPLWDKLTF